MKSEKDLSDYRKIYQKNELSEDHIPNNPIQLFQTWFYEVEKNGGVEEANAMTVSTIGLDGFPKNRIVLLKKFNENGFIFYTNYKSEKGKAIEANPNVCLSFFWPNMERQVIVKGKATKIAENLSDNYFKSRPRGSQLGAIISEQSEILLSRETLEKKMELVEKEYFGREVIRPSYWGGYIVSPSTIEFWQGRQNRLHDRIRYILQKNYNWRIERLNP